MMIQVISNRYHLISPTAARTAILAIRQIVHMMTTYVPGGRTIGSMTNYAALFIYR